MENRGVVVLVGTCLTREVAREPCCTSCPRVRESYPRQLISRMIMGLRGYVRTWIYESANCKKGYSTTHVKNTDHFVPRCTQ